VLAKHKSTRADEDLLKSYRFCGVNGRKRRRIKMDIKGAEHNRLDTTAISQNGDVRNSSW